MYKVPGEEACMYFYPQEETKLVNANAQWRQLLRKRKINTNGFLSKPNRFSKYSCIKPMYKFVAEFMNTTSLHGWNQLPPRGRHWMEYTFWSIILLAAFVTTFYVCHLMWERYQISPTAMTIERNYIEWNISFPTGFLCSRKKINRDALAVMSEQYNITRKEEFVEFIAQLARSSFYEWNQLPQYSGVKPEDYRSIIIQSSYTMQYQFSSSVEKDVKDLGPVWTESGICFAYNSKIAPLFDPSWIVSGSVTEPELADVVLISALDGEVFAQVKDIANPYGISIMGPYEVPYLGSPKHLGTADTHKLLEVACLPIISEWNVRSLSVSQRKCRVRGDGDLTIAPVYSYNMCRVECRMRLIYELCNCIPYMYSMPGKPTCNVTGMHCISKHAEYITLLRKTRTNEHRSCPDCYPLCTDYHFRVLYESDMPPPSQAQAQQTTWIQSQFPRMRFKRTVVFNFADLCIYMGACAGLLTGASILSLIEVVYFFTLRLLVSYVRYRQKKKRIRLDKAHPIGEQFSLKHSTFNNSGLIGPLLIQCSLHTRSVVFQKKSYRLLIATCYFGKHVRVACSYSAFLLNMYYGELQPKLFTIDPCSGKKTLSEKKKKQNYLKKESYLRRIFSYIYDFFNMTSIHGFRHLTVSERHFLERAMWAVMVAGAISGTTYFGKLSWHRYQTAPTVVAIMRDYKEWNTSIPAATICPHEKLDKEKVEKYLNDKNDSFENKTIAMNFLNFLANFSLTSSNSDDFDAVAFNKIPPSQYVNLLIELRSNFNYQGRELANFSDGAIVDTRATLVEKGLCYAFNSKIGIARSPALFMNLKESAASRWNEVLTWATNDTVRGSIGEEFTAMQISDLNLHSYDVQFTAYNELPDVTVFSHEIKTRAYMRVQFSAFSMEAAEDLKDLQPHQRHCRFTLESNLQSSLMYSYNLCRTECRARLIFERCKCVPHFYRKIYILGTWPSTCDIKGLKCVKEHAMLIVNLRYDNGTKIDCDCLQNCEEVFYTVEETIVSEWFVEAILKWHISVYPKIKFRREIIFSFADLMVSVGGTAGLFLGCSVLSFIEIIYFFTFRLLSTYFKKKKEWKLGLRSGQIVNQTRMFLSTKEDYRSQL